MKQSLPRGIRNNNPGNIRLSKDPWQGLAQVQDDKEFFKFETMTFGVRALACTIITYYDKYHISTIEDLIKRYAPKSENYTEKYIDFVVRRSGFRSDRLLDFHQYDHIRPVVEAIILYENALYKIDPDIIEVALHAAGVKHATIQPRSSKRLKGTAIITSGATISVVSEITKTTNDILPAFSLIDRIYQMAPWLGMALLVGGVGYLGYRFYKEKKTGLL